MQVTVTRWRKDERNTRQGYADFRIGEIGIHIKDCPIHKLGPDRQNKVFVSFPAREYTDSRGEKKWWNYVHFDRDRSEEFQQAAVVALAQHLKALPVQGDAAKQGPPPARAELDDEIPF